MDWQAQHAEELRLQEDIEEALERAAQHKATDDDIALLAWAAGVRRKGEQHEMV